MTKSASGRVGAALVLIAGLSACGTPSPATFESVAQSGAKFADSTPPLLTTALEQAISANSATLVMNHATASEDARKQALLTADDAYRERAKIFADVSQQARLLSAYFVAMEGLANTSGDSALGSATTNLVNAMGGIAPAIEKFEVAGKPVSELAGSIAPIVVGEFRSAALERELRAHGNAVVRAIELQRAFLVAVAGDLHSQLQALQQEQAFDDVVEPYLSSRPLPTDWAQRRSAALEQSVSVSTLTDAAAAAEKLKLTFIAAAEGSASEGLFAQLKQDVERLAALVQALQAAQTEAT